MVTSFQKDGLEALQRQLAADLGTDKAAVSCAQLTRLPGFLNHKYRPGYVVTGDYPSLRRNCGPCDFSRMAWPEKVQTALPQPPATQTDSQKAVDRARLYIAAIPPAVSGQRGDAVTFQVCCRLVRGFALSDEQALALLVDWNQACLPPWSPSELTKKLDAARLYGREPFGGLP